MVSRSDDPLIGTTLPGGYVILELVGVGGMGRVYRAEQKALGRTVAVKIIHPHLLGDENASVRFITEARAASRLNHPNSVAVIDFGKNGDQLYLVMELLRGRDLARVVYEDGPLPFRRVVDVMCQVLAALAEAHHLDIIHRDLKPENIVLEPMRSGGDFVKVVDFGLAKMRVEVASTNITLPGIVCGTPDYMAPEQGRGDLIDGRSDLYGVGVILYQLLTGRLPFEAESPTQVVLMHLSRPPADPRKVAPEREIPDPLAAVCLRALEKDPAQRYQTADQFAAALRDSLAALTPSLSRGAPGEGGVACTSCGSNVPAKQKFCGECGARVVRAGAPGPLATPGIPSEKVREARLPLPFSARDADLEWLEARRRDVGGATLAVRLVGEHGVGKSRLLREFLATAAAVGDLIVETGPDPWGAEVGYFALRRSVADLAGLPPGGGDPSRWVAATPEARSGLAEIFGVRLDGSSDRLHASDLADGLAPEHRRYMAAEALRWAVLRASEDGPRGGHVILAIDDLHAIDGASRNAFSDVIAEPPLAPLLVLATHVPGFDPGWGGSARRVAGLPTAVAASLVKGVAAPHRAPTGSDQKTVPPLYIEHLVRFNLEGGGEPPARIADLIALRIERLPPDARRTLQAVAVLGDATNRDTLSQVLRDVPGFDRVLASLVEGGLIEEEMRSTVGPRTLRPDATRLRTTHPLVRDVTLASIPAGVRRDLHAAAILVGDRDPRPLEVQAVHAYHAQDSFEAMMLLEQVANRAAARGDPRGAVLALRRGLDVARHEMFRGEIDDPVRAVLIFSQKLGEALAFAGDLTDADGVLREALDLSEPTGPERAQMLGLLAYVSMERDRAAEATSYLHEALKLAWAAQAADLVESLERMQADWGAETR
jgi:serine/threonine-protein kinase